MKASRNHDVYDTWAVCDNRLRAQATKKERKRKKERERERERRGQATREVEHKKLHKRVLLKRRVRGIRKVEGASY